MKATANKSRRTFTLRTESGNKYRTTPMSKTEFEEAEFNTPGDWENFLRTQNGSYYKV